MANDWLAENAQTYKQFNRMIEGLVNETVTMKEYVQAVEHLRLITPIPLEKLNLKLRELKISRVVGEDEVVRHRVNWGKMCINRRVRYVRKGQSSIEIYFRGCDQKERKVDCFKCDNANMNWSEPIVYNNCTCSLLIATMKRTCNVLCEPVLGSWAAKKELALSLFPKANYNTDSYEEFMEHKHFSKAKTILYETAIENLKDNGLKESIVTPFTKLECSKNAKKMKPRNIYDAGPEFNIEGGRRLHGAEKDLYKLKLNGVPCIAKGQSAKNWASHIATFNSHFKYCASADMKSFESHVNTECMKLVFEVQAALNPEMEFINHLRSDKNGVPFRKIESANKYFSYVANYGLPSGDFDTAFIGTLVSILLILNHFDKMGYAYEIQNNGHCVNIVTTDFAFYDNGDDILVFTHEELNKKSFVDNYADLGFTSVFDGMTTRLSDIVFCRSFYHQSRGEEYMVREVERIVMNNLCTKEGHGLGGRNYYILKLFIKSYALALTLPPELKPYFQILTNRCFVASELNYAEVKLKIQQHGLIALDNWQFSNKIENNIGTDDFLKGLMSFEPFTNIDMSTNFREYNVYNLLNLAVFQ